MASLRGIRVLVTRPQGQASALAEALEAAGATAVLIPAIEVVPPASFAALDAAIGALPAYDWALFTSANAVGALGERAATLGAGLTAQRIAVIGPATGEAVQRVFGRAPDLMPQEYVAEALLEALRPHAAGASMLLVRAATAREVLPVGLTDLGARVTVAEAYRTVVPQESIEAVRALFTNEPPNAITFTSASTAQNLDGLLQEAGLVMPAGTVLASIGPVTSEAMRRLGMEPTVEAAESTIPGLVRALSHAHQARTND